MSQQQRQQPHQRLMYPDPTITASSATTTTPASSQRRSSFQLQDILIGNSTNADDFCADDITKRLAEEAQDAELLQLAMELSISGDNMNYSEHSEHHHHHHHPGPMGMSMSHSQSNPLRSAHTVDTTRPTTTTMTTTATSTTTTTLPTSSFHSHQQQYHPYPHQQPISRHNSACTAETSPITSAATSTTAISSASSTATSPSSYITTTATPTTIAKIPGVTAISTTSSSNNNNNYTAPLTNAMTTAGTPTSPTNVVVAPYRRRSILRQTPSSRSLEQQQQPDVANVQRNNHNANQQPQHLSTPPTTATATATRYQRPSIMQQTFSSRSLEDFIFGGSNRSKTNTNTATAKSSTQSNNNNKKNSSNSSCNSIDSVGRSNRNTKAIMGTNIEIKKPFPSDVSTAVVVSSQQQLLPQVELYNNINPNSVGSGSGVVQRRRYNTSDHDSNSIGDLEDISDDDEDEEDDRDEGKEDDNDHDDDDDDDDDDYDDWEDLDPDDTPDLRRVAKELQQPRSPRSGTSSKMAIPDLQAATEQFRQKMMASKASSVATTNNNNNNNSTSGNIVSSSLSMERRNGRQQQQQQQSQQSQTQQKKPGVERVKTAAPKVKPPGRPRTAVSRVSPAIDDDVLRKIQQKNNSNSNTSNSNSTTAANTTDAATSATSSTTRNKASKPGAVAVDAAVPITTKTPEARSAIVSHILNSTEPGTPSTSTAHHSQQQQPPQQQKSAPAPFHSATERRKRFSLDGGVARSLSSDDRLLQLQQQRQQQLQQQQHQQLKSLAPSASSNHRTNIDPQQQRHETDRCAEPSIDMYNDRSPYQYNPQQQQLYTMQMQQQQQVASPTTNVWNADSTVNRRQSGSPPLGSNDWPSLSDRQQQQQQKNKGPDERSKLDDSYAPPELFNLERAILGRRTEPASNAPTSSLASPTASGTRRHSLSSQAAVIRRSSDTYDLSGASQFLTEEELLNIQEALKDEVIASSNDEYNSHAVVAPQQNGHSISDISVDKLSPDEEAAAIARALQEADEEEERRSFELAMLMQREEAIQFKSNQQQQPQHHNQGNVRTMTRQQYAVQQFEQFATTNNMNSQARTLSIHDHENDFHDDNLAAGFRMNSTVQHKWSRLDQTSVVGPNNEIRTKHDRALHNEANAHRLGLFPDSSNGSGIANVGNQAYNSFLSSMKNTTKGVATKGTGRAGSDTDGTKGGAMDPTVRQIISRAINNEIIEKCNGVVKEGKEAIVYHADKGAESGGFDVAVKVFKKIQEFRNRGYYVDGDPRYGNTNFRNLSSNEQLELWAEKEFRNLTRASRAGVPVPIPLFHKENILFMRFLGDDGWPAPQLRELELNHGSRRWLTLFSQVIDAMKLLYQGGHLVHGDLSEYNILVAPSYFVVGPSVAIGSHLHHAKNGQMMNGEDLQIVLIDFGQAVDTRHPEASILLQRDLDRVLTFFAYQGIEIPSLDDAMSIIMG